MPQKIGKIYYVIPDIQRHDYSLIKLAKAFYRGNLLQHFQQNWFSKHKPVGGIKVIFQHCVILRALGFEAIPLRMGDYCGNFFNFDIESKTIAEVGFELNENDVVVIPEHVPEIGLMFNCGFRVLFAQNGALLYKDWHFPSGISSYVDLGYDYIFYCSNHIAKDLSHEPKDRLYLIDNFIDQTLFRPNESSRKPGQILGLPRKNPDDLKQIMKLIGNGSSHRFVLVDGVTESEIIAAYQQSDIFLATGYPEGFGLPPLEAMACGAAVVGFTGGGADEFMRDGETALVVADGDTDAAANCLRTLLVDNELKEHIRKAGTRIAQTYTRARAEKQLTQFFGTHIWSCRHNAETSIPNSFASTASVGMAP